MSKFDDWKKSDANLWIARTILALEAAQVATVKQDLQEGFDLCIAPRTAAVRFRYAEGYSQAELERYFKQVTLRKRRPSGAKTELAKVLEGGVDRLFYGWIGPGRYARLVHFHLCDLQKLAAAIKSPPPGFSKGSVGNPDGTGFLWADLTSLPDPSQVVLRSSLINPSTDLEILNDGRLLVGPDGKPLSNVEKALIEDARPPGRDKCSPLHLNSRKK